MAADDTLRVFISSPSDVRPERLVAQRIVQRLDREFAHHFRLEAVLWENEPLFATHHFQDRENIPEPHETDIVIVILWSQLGVPLPTDRFIGKVSGKVPVTGTEWEFEDALFAYRQVRRPSLLLYRKTAEVNANLNDRARLKEKLIQQDMLEEFFLRWIRQGPEAEFTAAIHTVADTVEFEERLETHLRGLLRRRLESAGGQSLPATIRWHRGSPFLGLSAFEAEHAPVFFGRARARNELRERLIRQQERGHRFLLVTGASGTGKSSLINAGLLPDLKLPGMAGNVALCRTVTVRPSMLTDGDPVVALATALMTGEGLPELRSQHWHPQLLAAALTADNADKCCLAIEQGMAAASDAAGLTGSAEARLVLVIDQFEELFTLNSLTDAGRRALAQALTALVQSKSIWVIAVMRSDFVDRLDGVPELAALADGDSRYSLRPPDALEIGQIIRQPAREADLRYEVDQRGIGLDDVLCETAGRNPAALPLLEFMLDQLWHRRTKQGVLTYEAYHEIGGLEGAIGRHADTVVGTLPDAARSALPNLLRALVTVRADAAGTVTSHPAPLSRFPEGSPYRALIDALTAPEARLLEVEDAGDGLQIRLVHEALLTHWPLARDRMDRDRQDLQVRARLESAERLWRAAGVRDRDSRLLKPGLPLSEAEDLLARRRDDLTQGTVDFVAASLAAGRKSERNKALAVVCFAALAFVATVLAAVSYEKYLEATAAEERAQASLTLVSDVADMSVVELGERLRMLTTMPVEARTHIEKLSQEMLNRLTASGDRSDRVTLLQGRLLNSMAQTLVTVGKLDIAEEKAKGALASLKPLLEQPDPPPSAFLAMAISNDLLGDAMRARGDKVGALVHYEASSALRERLFAIDQSDQKASVALSMSYIRNGNIYSDRQQWDHAEAAFSRALTLRKALLERYPDDIEVASGLSLAFNKVGNILFKKNMVQESIDHFKKSLEVSESYASRQPNQLRLWNDLAHSHENLGNSYLTESDPHQAKSHFEDCQDLRSKMVEKDQKNIIAKHDLAVCLAGLAKANWILERKEEAIKQIGVAKTLMELSVNTSPNNMKWHQENNSINNMMENIFIIQPDSYNSPSDLSKP
ncbi:ATP-binding protein [Azospirillum humicireducens]|uniref:ATP-binding protein n=1 Tax=Azospirillum humicireducens TaxID=1226968 RepID=UPI001304ABFA|nr:ATP-binding protein [Azospirillum humicireducens]